MALCARLKLCSLLMERMRGTVTKVKEWMKGLNEDCASKFDALDVVMNLSVGSFPAL